QGMNAMELSTLGAGFTDEAHGSQAVFRAVLQALSHPGRPVEVAHDAQVPSRGNAASAGLLLALMDADSRLWVSPTLAASDAPAWLRFHTGCSIVNDPRQAQFAWIAEGPGELPPLDAFAQGSQSYPDTSTTCVIDMKAFASDEEACAAGQRWTLRGPGIAGATQLAVHGLPAAFSLHWAANHALFPCGVDVLLASSRHVVGLPRTTQVEPSAKA
ncbi:MAG TPA: phosphonate C-P lyase system protein PhnH, partial [Variovorax sp.]